MDLKVDRFELLGRVRALRGDDELNVGGPKPRAVLAVLLLHANELVPRDRLIGDVWGSEPPERATNVLHTYIRQLRTALHTADHRPLVHEGNGYRLAIDPSTVDVKVFDQLVAEARARRDEGDLAGAAGVLDRAKDLWHEPPFGGVAGAFVSDERVRLTGQYATMMEDRAEAKLALGAGADLVADLAPLSHAHPDRQRLRGLLMRALYRAGRQTEALDEYRSLRDHLVKTTGLEPGEQIRRLHRMILQQDPALDAPTDPADRLIPADLPPDVFGFTAREEELRRLDALSNADHPPIVALTGTAGVGKTALAVHWAHRSTALFPDGLLYVDLHGYHVDQPAAAAEVLEALLRRLGVASTDMPKQLAERTARYRSLLAGRRMLVVLDNAYSAEQVQDLLPGTGSCLTVVTSRNDLAGLVARYGAHTVDLDLLPPTEAVALLRSRIPDRVGSEPAAAAELARLCAGLPLALAVAAEVARSRRGTSLADLAVELTDERSRLDLLDAGGDPHTAVRAVLSWSYRHLPEPVARLFRLGGLHPGTSIDRYAAAALTGTDPAQAGRWANALLRANLWVEIGANRYGMHDLLRLYARECAEADEAADQQRDAIRRLLVWYVHAAAGAERHLTAKRRQIDLEPLEGAPAPPALADEREALRWLEAERINLVAASGKAFEEGLFPLAWKLPALLGLFFYRRKYWTDWVSTHETALIAAERAEDRAGVAWVSTSLGNAYYDQGRYKEALVQQERALEIRRQLGDRWGAAINLLNLAEAYVGLRQFTVAVGTFQDAFAGFEEVGDPYGQAMTLSNLGNLYYESDRLDEALDHTMRALPLRRALGDRNGLSFTLNCLGDIYRKLGRFDEAVQALEEARELRRESRDAHNEAMTLCSLAEVMEATGRANDAARFWTEAAAMLDEIDPERAATIRRRAPIRP